MPWVAARRLDLDGSHFAEIGEVWPFEPAASMVQLKHIVWMDSGDWPMPDGYKVADEPKETISQPIEQPAQEPEPTQAPMVMAESVPVSNVVEVIHSKVTKRRRKK